MLQHNTETEKQKNPNPNEKPFMVNIWGKLTVQMAEPLKSAQNSNYLRQMHIGEILFFSKLAHNFTHKFFYLEIYVVICNESTTLQVHPSDILSLRNF